MSNEKYELKCFNCGRLPHEIEEYVVRAHEEETTPQLYVIEEEGTYNPDNGHFCCTECYVQIGMPITEEGWKAP